MSPHDTAPLDWVAMTTRLRPDLHADLEAVKNRTGKSINMMINEYVEQGLAQAGGGTAKIARMSRRLPRRSEPARAAVAYLLGYLGQAGQARKWFPWSGRLAVKMGDLDVLPLVGALVAAEIDRKEGAST